MGPGTLQIRIISADRATPGFETAKQIFVSR